MYIGRSSKGLRRPREHGEAKYIAGHSTLPVVRWIQKLRRAGLNYEIVILEEVASADQLNEAERFHIMYLRSVGASLLNCTDGGDGIQGHRFSAATRAKMSADRKGRKLLPETIVKLRIVNTGKKMPAAAIARTRAAHLGKKRSAETRQRLSVSHTGKKLSASNKAKIAAANRQRTYYLKDGTPRTPEQRSAAPNARSFRRARARATAT